VRLKQRESSAKEERTPRVVIDQESGVQDAAGRCDWGGRLRGSDATSAATGGEDSSFCGTATDAV